MGGRSLVGWGRRDRSAWRRRKTARHGRDTCQPRGSFPRFAKKTPTSIRARPRRTSISTPHIAESFAAAPSTTRQAPPSISSFIGRANVKDDRRIPSRLMQKTPFARFRDSIFPVFISHQPRWGNVLSAGQPQGRSTDRRPRWVVKMAGSAVEGWDEPATQWPGKLAFWAEADGERRRGGCSAISHRFSTSAIRPRHTPASSVAMCDEKKNRRHLHHRRPANPQGKPCRSEPLVVNCGSSPLRHKPPMSCCMA